MESEEAPDASTVRVKESLIHSLVQSYLFLRTLGYRYHKFFTSVVFDLMASALQFALLDLFFLLVRAIMSKNYGSIVKRKFMARIFHYLPTSFSEGFRAVEVLVVLLVVIKICNFIAQYISKLLVNFESREIVHKIRTKVYRRFLGFGKAFFDQSTLAQQNKIIHDCSREISNQIGAFHTVSSEGLRLGVMIIMLCRLSWVLTACAFALILVGSWFSKKIGSKVNATSNELFQATLDLEERLFNTLSCSTLVKLSNSEETEERIFAGYTAQTTKIGRRMFKLESLLAFMSDANMLISMLCLALLIPVVFPLDQQFSPSNSISFFIILRLLEPTTRKLFRSLSILESPTKGLSQVMKILGSESDRYLIQGGVQNLQRFERELEVRHLSFEYLPNQPALRDVSFRIKRGDFVGIVGHTGSGKTSLLQIILRLYNVPSQSLFIDGVPIEVYTPESVRRMFTMVTQTPILMNESLRNNLTYGIQREVTVDELDRASKAAQIYEFVYQLPGRYETPVRNLGLKFSVGERQRLAIARCFLSPSSVLIFDEATSALDTRTEQLVQNAVEELRKDRTIILVAHRFHSIKNVDYLLVLSKGKLVEAGRVNELIEKKGEFWELMKNQLPREVPAKKIAD